MPETDPVDVDRLSMSLGEAMFTPTGDPPFRPDPIPMEDLRLIVEAAAKAPNGGNLQRGRFLVVDDPDTIREFGALYQEAWWAKRHDEGFHDRDDLPPRFLPAAGLADAMAAVPCIVFALALPGGAPDSIIPAVQNLMLAARGLGIGSVPTTLHPTVMDRFRAMFDVPDDVGFFFCVPLGYPAGRFGPNVRRPTAQTTFLNRWNNRVPWADSPGR